MLEELLKWIFAGLVQAIFFRLGSFYLWLLSIGRVKTYLKDAKPITVFGVSMFGFLFTLILILTIANLVG